MVKATPGLDDGLEHVVNAAKLLLSKKSVVIIGVSGGSGSGKTHFSKMLSKRLDGKIISTDDYYKNLDKKKDKNFDHPDAVEIGLLREHLAQLKQNKVVRKPIYDFKTHRRAGTEECHPGKVVIVEGLFSFHGILAGECDIRVFLEAHEKTRLSRRTARDISERKRSEEDVKKQWTGSVQSMYEKHVIPLKRHADFIIINE